MKVGECVAFLGLLGSLCVALYMGCKDLTKGKYKSQTKGLEDLANKGSYTYLDNNNDGVGYAK